ncbi:hypothetical protein E1B22_02135 [Thermaerobacter sp. FW80]|uniref:hypothetical protein n=1 Tax=Thermaerobacter sp. FW80 TaxID=2546351 RepID=UPI0010751DDC|nr:hypothetical protein [Thermaerobacter sp. FW80]QBS36862.1 hypothetical protein E1B22_02135 [Thermaerobacter sp. FW80]
MAEPLHGDDKSWLSTLNALRNNMKVDDLCYMRDRGGTYWLGRITSEWRYDGDPELFSADLVNVRSCEWYCVGSADAVPGKVAASFRARRTLQRISDVELYSKILYNRLSQSSYYCVDATDVGSREFWALLSDEDCEDLVAIYLQVERDFVIVPSTCKRDTAGYEYVLVHRHTGQRAVVQVKSGDTPATAMSVQDPGTKVFLFAASGSYGGDCSGCVCLDPNEVRDFALEKTQILPRRIQAWIEEWRRLSRSSA